MPVPRYVQRMALSALSVACWRCDLVRSRRVALTKLSTVEFGLLLQAVVEEFTDVGVLGDGQFYLALARSRSDFFDHQGVELVCCDSSNQ